MFSQHEPNGNISMADALSEIKVRIMVLIDVSSANPEIVEFSKAFEDFLFARDIFWKLKSDYIRDGKLSPGSVILIKKVSPILTMTTVIGEAVLEGAIDVSSIHLSIKRLLENLENIQTEFADNK